MYLFCHFHEITERFCLSLNEMQVSPTSLYAHQKLVVVTLLELIAMRLASHAIPDARRRLPHRCYVVSVLLHHRMFLLVTRHTHARAAGLLTLVKL